MVARKAEKIDPRRVSANRVESAAAVSARSRIDVEALFSSTMRRFPKTMARLAE